MVFPIKKRIISIGGSCAAPAPMMAVPSPPLPVQQRSGLDILSAVASSPQLKLSNPRSLDSPLHNNVSANISINSLPSSVPSSPRQLSAPSSSLSSTDDVVETTSSSNASNSATSIATTQYQNTKSSKTQRAKTFPEILFEILSDNEYSNIISWLPAGTSFAIHDISQFQCVILPKYFRKVIFRSFVRKLNRWGFRSVKRSVSGFETTFEHKLFQRDDPDNMSMNMYCKSNPASKADTAAGLAGAKAPTHVGHNGSGRKGRRVKAAVKISNSANKVSNTNMASTPSAASHLISSSGVFPQGLEADHTKGNSRFSTFQDDLQGPTMIHQGNPAVIHHPHSQGPLMHEVLQRYHDGLILREIQQQRILSLVEQMNLQQQSQLVPCSNAQQLQVLLALNQQRQQQEHLQQEELHRRAQQELLLQGLQEG